MRQAFTVPGPPVPKGRPRTFLHHGRIITTTPPATRDYERKVKTCAIAAGVRLLRGPLAVEVLCFLPDRRHRDADNLGKAITDALNKLAYDDDDQIHDLVVRKRIDRAAPRAEVVIEQIEIEEEAA